MHLSLGLVVALLAPPNTSGDDDRPPVQVPKSHVRPKPAPIQTTPPPTATLIDPSDLPDDARTLVEPENPWKLPRDGGGALVSSGMMFAATLGLGITAIALAPRAYFEPEGLMGAGAGVLGVGGAVALGFALATRRQYRATELGQAPDRPRTGRGLHVAAGITMTAASLTLLIGQALLFAPSEEEFNEPFAEIGMIAGGAGFLVIGSSMLVVSQVRRTRYQRWTEQRPARVRPSFAIGRGGLQCGVAGRF